MGLPDAKVFLLVCEGPTDIEVIKSIAEKSRIILVRQLK